MANPTKVDAAFIQKAVSLYKWARKELDPWSDEFDDAMDEFYAACADACHGTYGHVSSVIQAVLDYRPDVGYPFVRTVLQFALGIEVEE